MKDYLIISLVPREGGREGFLEFRVFNGSHEEACRHGMILGNRPMKESELPKEDFSEWLGASEVVEIDLTGMRFSENPFKINDDDSDLQLDLMEKALDKRGMLISLMNIGGLFGYAK